jgi:hypothetical protein
VFGCTAISLRSTKNVILNNDYGISFEGNHFEIYCNNITGNNVDIFVSGSSSDVVVYDNVIVFNGGSHEPFCGGPGAGVCIYGSNNHNITFYHNSFIKTILITKNKFISLSLAINGITIILLNVTIEVIT